MHDPTPEIVVLNLRTTLRGEDERGTRWAYDAAKAVAALQGIVNRRKPCLFLRYLSNGLMREKQQASASCSLDEYWLSWLRQDGRTLMDHTLVETDQICEVFKQFADSIHGIVVWDESVPSTANVASTLAGAKNLIPLRGSMAADSFFCQFRELFPDIPVEHDLRGMFTGKGTIPETTLASTGSARCDAYLWAVENVLKKGLCSPAHLAYYVDGIPWNVVAPKSLPYPDLGNAGVLNADYWISRQAFFFDLSPWDDEPGTDDPEQAPGTDYRTLITILEAANEMTEGKRMLTCGGFVPWWLKHCRADWNGRNPDMSKHDAVPAEWRFVDILTAHNGMLDADAYGLTGLTNASVYQHFKLKGKYHQSNSGSDKPYDPQKTYVLFGMLDYDSAAWLAQAIPANWDDPNRGKVPLWWGFNPVLSDRVPMVFDHVYSTLTPNDTVGADEGLGYVNPNLLEGNRKFSNLPPAGDLYLQQAKPYFERFSMTTTVFVIVGDQLPVTQRTLQILAETSPDGIGFQGGDRVQDGVYCGVGFKQEEQDWFYAMKEEECVKALEHFIRQKSPGGFVFFRCILFSPTQIFKAVERLKEQSPDLDFEVLDPITYFRFLKQQKAR